MFLAPCASEVALLVSCDEAQGGHVGVSFHHPLYLFKHTPVSYLGFCHPWVLELTLRHPP